MKRTFLVLSVLALTTSVALAESNFPAPNWGAGGFGVGVGGAGTSWSGAGHLNGAAQFGSSTASAQGQSFGQAESGFGVGVGNLPDGSPASGAYGNFAGATVMSGSMSNAAVTANGNGFSGAGAIGGGFAGTTLGGIGAGGFVTLP